MWVSYLEGLGGGPQLCHRVVVRQQVGQLALCVQRRQRGHRLLQLADPLLIGLQRREESLYNVFVSCYDPGKV